MSYDEWLQRVPNQVDHAPYRLVLRKGGTARTVPMKREREEVHLWNIGKRMVQRGKVSGFRAGLDKLAR